jgi:hypothetical protein
MPRSFRILTSLLLAGTALSCSPYESRLPESGATLHGAVTLAGEKVPLALVVVVGPRGSATGQVEDGHYRVENVPLGEVKIGINTEATRGQMISLQMAQGYKGPGAKGGSRPPAPRFVEVPSKYWLAEKSGIATTVKKGDNALDIALTK